MEKKKLNLLVTALVIALFSAVAAVSAAADEDNAVIDQDQISNQIPDAVPLKPFLEGASPAEIEETIAKMSYVPSIYLAQKYGITTIRGKKVDLDRGVSKGAPSPRTLADRPVGADPMIAENEPSIAVKPNNSNIVVAASHSIPGTPCVAYYSLDHGETWSAKVNLPLPASTYCSDPVVRWAPDSTRVYAAYMAIGSTGISTP